MKTIPIVSGKFTIATPPDGKLEERDGYIMGRFGIHSNTVFCDEEQMEFTAYAVTHLNSGWGITVVDEFSEAKALCSLLNMNKEWDEVKTVGGKVENSPKSCKRQVQEFKRSCGYYSGNYIEKPLDS